MKTKKITALLAACALLAAAYGAFPEKRAYAASSDDYASAQVAVTAPDEPQPDSAYIIFSKEAQKHKMTYYGSEEEDRYGELYSEPVVWGGVSARQVFVQNSFYLKLDEGYAASDDNVFSITLDYWDYGGGGYFYVDYIPKGKQEVKTERVYKLGLDENNQKTEGTWFRVRICLDDAEFTGKFENGADIRIRSGAYNSFSKIEVRNLSGAATSTEDYGTFNLGKAKALHSLGVFDGFGEEGGEFIPSLEKQLTREEALCLLVKCYGAEKEALAENEKSGFTDVSAEYEPYVAKAKRLGAVTGDGMLGAGEYFSQEELIKQYLRLYGAPESAYAQDVYAYAREVGLITTGGMLFQPQKRANVDALVHLAMNLFAKPNLKDGTSPFSKGFEAGLYSMETISNTDDDSLWSWLMSTPFKLPKTTHVDKHTGRTYYTVNFFGKQAIKPYFTMNCISMDETRIYFRTQDYKFWEYNIETEMCRYMADTPNENNTMVTPQNNLWYVNADLEIHKVDLDTYEDTLIANVPEFGKTNISLLQVNNDESKLSLWWVDSSGEFDSSRYMRLPVLDIKTGEWDLSHWYGFDYPDYAPNHPCLNPNPDYDYLYFFAHETIDATRRYFYENSDMPERVWVANFKTGEYYNALKQKWHRTPDPDKPGSGFGGELVGHELWSPDGEWLYATRHPKKLDGLRESVEPEAHFVMERALGTEKRYIKCDFSETERIIGNGGSDSNHSMLSWDNRFIVADNNYYGGKYSGLYVFDAETGESHLMAILAENGQNPGHVHPQFSPSGKYAIFGCWTDDYKTPQFGWMDVSDITSNPTPGGRYDISETCDAIDYDGDFDFNVEPVYKNGVYEKTIVPAGKSLYVNVKGSVCEKDNVSAKITVTYEDTTTLPISLTYHRWLESSHKFTNKLTTDKLYIKRTNSGKTKSETFTFDDISFGNMELYGSDFLIGAVGADASIVSVDVEIVSVKGE